MNVQNQQVSPLKQKFGYYKAVFKEIASNKKVVVTTLLAVGTVTMPEALAAGGVTSELNFKSLADEALDSIKNAGKAAMAVFGVGITITGSFKGYSLLKGGIKRA